MSNHDPFYDDRGGQMPPQKPKKSLGKKIGIGCGVIVLLFVLMFGCSAIMMSGSNNNDENENKDYGIGETASVDGIEVTLKSVEEMSEIPTMGTTSPAPSGTVFLVADFRVLNNSDSEEMISSSDFSAYINNSSVDLSTYNITLDGSFNADYSLEPTRETSGKIVYEAPPDWQTFEVKFQPDALVDHSATFKVDASQVRK